MKTNPFKNFLKTTLFMMAVLLSFVGFGQNSIDQSSYASSLASVSKTSAYRWEKTLDFEEYTTSKASSVSSPTTCMTLSVNVTDNLCSGQRNGAIDLTVTGNSGPFAYDWQFDFNDLHGATNQDLTGLISTTYTVVVTSADGCVATLTTSVGYAHVSPTVTITPTICFGQTTTLTVSGALTYTWNSGETVATITASAAGNPHEVTGTDANGCTNFDELYLDVHTPTVTAVPSQTICVGQSAFLSASGAVSYTWNPGGIVSQTISVTPASTTVYTVTGMDACSNTLAATSTVTVNNSSSPPSISISGSSLICSGTTYSYTASGASTYTWTSSITGNTTYTYNPFTIDGGFFNDGTSNVLYVSGTNGSTGCVSSSSITINNVTPTFTYGAIDETDLHYRKICTGQSYTINVSVSVGSTYTWTPYLGSTLNPIVTPTTSSEYTLTVSNGTCTTTGSIYINVLTTPTISVASPVNICSGSSYTINPVVTGTVSGEGTHTAYDWSPSTNLSSTNTYSTVATVTNTAEYVLTTSNVYSVSVFETPQIFVCQDQDTVTLNVIANPTISISGNTYACPNYQDTLTASGATSYTWSTTNNGGATITTNSLIIGVGLQYEGFVGLEMAYDSTQVFTVIGSNLSGCTSTATYTVVAPVPSFTYNLNTLDATYDSPLVICSGTSYTIHAQIETGNTYTWTPALDGTLNPVISPTVGTGYTLTVSNGTCTASKPANLNVIATPTISIVAPESICAGNSYTLNPSLAGVGISTIYNWSPPTDLSSTNTATTVATPSTSTSYSLIATNNLVHGIGIVDDTVVGAISCIDTASVTINITGSPPIPTINYSSKCDSNYTTLNIPGANSTYTYTWNGPCYTGAGSSVNVNTIGIYTVSVTNSCGVVTTNTVSILVIGNIVAGFQTNIIHSFIEDGPHYEGGSSSEFIHFENLSLGNNLIYQWTFGNGDTSIVINPNETFDTVGVFQVHLYDSDSLHCKDTASATVVLSSHGTILIIPNRFTPNNDNVDDVFQINGVGVTNFKCQVSDTWGNLLYQWNNLNGSWNGIASNGHVYANGNYYYLLSYTDYNGLNQSRSGIIALKK